MRWRNLRHVYHGLATDDKRWAMNANHHVIAWHIWLAVRAAIADYRPRLPRPLTDDEFDDETERREGWMDDPL